MATAAMGSILDNKQHADYAAETLSDLRMSAETVSDLRMWNQILARYRQPSRARSALRLVITVVPLVLLWVLMWATLSFGCWHCLLHDEPCRGFVVRRFMIEHDWAMVPSSDIAWRTIGWVALLGF